MFKIKVYIICIIALVFYQFAAFAKTNMNAEQSQTVVKQKIQKAVPSSLKQSESTLEIAPEEVNLGIISLDKSGEGVFTLKSTGPRTVTWTTEGPKDWKNSEQQKLSGSLERTSASLRLEIQLFSKDSFINEDKDKDSFVYAEMTLESGGRKILCTKNISTGTYKEAISINSSQGRKTVFVKFIIAYTQINPLIRLTPLRLDMGSNLPGKIVTKKILLTNSGKEMLKWSVAARKHEKEDMPEVFHQGRYVSFYNESKGGVGYVLPDHLKETTEVIGKWAEENGYPSSTEDEGIIKINFSGTGIILYFLSYQKEGTLAVSLDNQLIDEKDLFKDVDEKKGEILISDKLAIGPHVLTITSKNNKILIEGMKLLGLATTFFPEKSIRVFPDSGATTRQTNYLTVSLNTAQLFPGFYEDDILFTSNGGETIVKVFTEILPENISKVVDVYRYYNGKDYLFTADPQAEIRRLFQNGYVKEGIAFRLFNPDTPGTACFYRWYNPQKKSHYYHYDYSGGKKDMRGYIFEGSIGNIATSKLTNTRELYRWYDPKTGHYFYSTDLRGEKIDKNVYRFDGIAGYVR